MESHLSFCVNTTTSRWGQAEWCAWEKGEWKAWCPEFVIHVNRTPGSERLHRGLTAMEDKDVAAGFIGQEKSPPMSHKDRKRDRNGSSP